MIKNLDKIIKRVLKEATGTGGGSRGSYVLPAQPGVRLFDKSQLAPFTDAVSEYNNARLGYDSYDGQMDVSKKEIKKIEAKSKKISKYKKENPFQNDDDGDILNRYSGDKKIKTDISKPFISEDLAVWFGTKKKPKGSSQPKGPWVNICRKDKDGKHPPCGRPEASDKGYPKCRAAGVAGKMSDSEKRSACQQKRKAEKTHSKSGTGNKPKMVSYKTNENMSKRITITESQLQSLVHYLNEQSTTTNTPPINLACFDTRNVTGPGTQIKNLIFKGKNGDKYTFETKSFEAYQKESNTKEFTKIKIENQEFKDFLTQKGVKDVDTRSFLYIPNYLNKSYYCSVFVRSSQDQTFADSNIITTLNPQ